MTSMRMKEESGDLLREEFGDLRETIRPITMKMRSKTEMKEGHDTPIKSKTVNLKGKSRSNLQILADIRK